MSAYSPSGFTFDGIDVHYIEGGEGFPLLLIHGSGPGASTMGNWRLVLEPLAAKYHVYAMDLIGFGQSGRKPNRPYFDLDLWFHQCLEMIGRIPGEHIGVLGHSISGALALKLAAAEPRIAKILTTGCMGAPFKVTEQTIRCWSFPRTKDDLRGMAEGLIHDTSLIDDDYIAAREKVLYGDAHYGAYFDTMFAGDKQFYADAVIVTAGELARITGEVTMLHGREDLAFPPSITIALAAALPQADVMLLAKCSHSIALEFPDKLLAAADLLFR